MTRLLRALSPRARRRRREHTRRFLASLRCAPETHCRILELHERVYDFEREEVWS